MEYFYHPCDKSFITLYWIIDYRVEGLEAAHAKNYPRIARSWRELQKVSEFFPSNKTFAAEMATSTGQSRV